MRSLSLMAVSVLAVGCAPDSTGGVVHQSVLQQPTNGVRLHADGTEGHAGMRGTNCPFETTYGSLTGDYDLPEDDEEVQDAGPSIAFGSRTVLLVQRDLVTLLSKHTGDYEIEQTVYEGVENARLTDHGLVVQTDACDVRWTDEDQVVNAPGCNGVLAVDPASQTAFVGGTPVAILPQGSGVTTDVDADLLAWDAAAEVTYAAVQGDSTVTALEVDGTVRWQHELEGPIAALSDAGANAMAVVSWTTEDGRGALTWIDGFTGEHRTEISTPSAAPDLTSSAHGRLLAVVLEFETHFFRMQLGR